MDRPEDIENEEWRDIPGYEGLYQVSNMGRVKSFHRGGQKILRISIDNFGYGHVNLHRHVPVHRLVAEVFIGKAPDMQEVNHKDCDKQNNKLENVEYVMHIDNMCHASKNGLLSKPKRKKVYYTIDKIEKHLDEWCKIYGINKNTVISRLRGGANIKDALTKQLRWKGRKI